MKGQGILIPEIPFFEDYILFLRIKHEAKITGENHVRFYIIKAVQEYIRGKDNIDVNLKTIERFHIACQKQAGVEGLSIAQFIEKVCAEKMGETYKMAGMQSKEKKSSFFDLNRDANKK